MKTKIAHILANIHVIPFHESGRTIGNHINIESYSPALKINEKYYDVFLRHETKSFLHSNEKIELGILFKFPLVQIGNLSIDDTFQLQEGPKATITGKITRILNPLFNRELWVRKLNKSIEELDNDKWERPHSFDSALIERCHGIRKKSLTTLSNEELRLTLSQEMGIKHTVALIIKKLLRNKFIECDFYPGDLLLATFRKLSSDWGESNFLKDDFTFLIRHQFTEIKQHDEIPEKVKKEIFEHLLEFENR